MFTFVAIHIPFPLIPRGLPSRFMYVSKNVKRHHKLHIFYTLWDFRWMVLFIFLWSTQVSFPTIDYACTVTVRWFWAHFLPINDAKSSTAKRRPVWRMPSFSPSSHSSPHIWFLSPHLWVCGRMWWTYFYSGWSFLNWCSFVQHCRPFFYGYMLVHLWWETVTCSEEPTGCG